MTALTLQAQAVCRRCAGAFDSVGGEPAPHGDLRLGGCAERVVVSPEGEVVVTSGDVEDTFAAASAAAKRAGWAYVAERRDDGMFVRSTSGPAPVRIFDKL